MPTFSALRSEQRSNLDHWFHRKGFRIAAFEKRKLRVSTDRMGEMLVFKLTERPGHTTYYKETTGGALIVFEVLVNENKITHEGYCPLLLFGIWEKKLRFKKSAGGLFNYREEGHRIEQQFVEHIRQL